MVRTFANYRVTKAHLAYSQTMRSDTQQEPLTAILGTRYSFESPPQGAPSVLPFMLVRFAAVVGQSAQLQRDRVQGEKAGLKGRVSGALREHMQGKQAQVTWHNEKDQHACMPDGLTPAASAKKGMRETQTF